MAKATRLWPLLTATQRYEKIVSTRNRGHGVFIEPFGLQFLTDAGAANLGTASVDD